MEQVILETLGKNIKRIRLLQGISQEKLAEISGLHRTYVGGVERGERNISLLNLARIASALQVSVSELVEGIR